MYKCKSAARRWKSVVGCPTHWYPQSYSSGRPHFDVHKHRLTGRRTKGIFAVRVSLTGITNNTTRQGFWKIHPYITKPQLYFISSELNMWMQFRNQITLYWMFRACEEFQNDIWSRKRIVLRVMQQRIVKSWWSNGLRNLVDCGQLLTSRVLHLRCKGQDGCKKRVRNMSRSRFHLTFPCWV